ncbi:hypothetical protein D3C86_1104310 [compost metagenome]
MIVDEDEGGGRELKRPAHDFPGIDGGMIHGAVSPPFRSDENVALVEIEGAKLLPRRMGQGGAQIGDQGGP